MTIYASPDLDVATLRATRNHMLARVETRITGFLAAERARWGSVNPRAAALVDAVSSLVEAGGKRLRPVFCLSGYLAAGGDPAGEDAVDASAALELLQAFALIHDDVLDNSELRRGAPTVHVHHAAEHEANGWLGEARRYGEGVAILAGDLAFAYADRLTAGLSPAARAIWDELRIEMIVGQHLDVAAAAEAVVDPQLCRWIAVCKSGRYTIHRPLELGAAIAGRPELASAFEGYGAALGEAFQLRDDVIDAFGDGAAGKPAGLDFAEHKMTLLLALAAERDTRVRALIDGGPGTPWDADLLRRALVESGVRDSVEGVIAELVGRARQAVQDSPLDTRWCAEFSALATRVAYRDR
jgi:geranylgeranyl diphosphate synthase, type I